MRANPRVDGDVWRGEDEAALMVERTIEAADTHGRFREILDAFFTVHDPTTLNRQGPDEGPQYRSAIFYHSDAQKAAAEQVIRDLTAARVWRDPIVTEVTPSQAFYKAEDYHQEYFKLHGEQPYCRAIISPKVAKFRARYRGKLKTSAGV